MSQAADTFALMLVEPPKPKAPARRKRLIATEGWQIVDHVCRACLGRVLRRVADDRAEFRCSNCGVTGHDAPRSICGCGFKLGKRDAGLRCVVNEVRTGEMPSEVIVKEGK